MSFLSGELWKGFVKKKHDLVGLQSRAWLSV